MYGLTEPIFASIDRFLFISSSSLAIETLIDLLRPSRSISVSLPLFDILLNSLKEFLKTLVDPIKSTSNSSNSEYRSFRSVPDQNLSSKVNLFSLAFLKKMYLSKIIIHEMIEAKIKTIITDLTTIPACKNNSIADTSFIFKDF